MKLAHHLVVTALLCFVACSEGTDPADPAIGTYDRVPGQAPRSATCGPFTVVDGLITIEADDTFLKVDVHVTPGGSSTCGYIGGTWVRIDANTLELTPDPAAFPGFGPQEVAVEGD